MDNLRQECGPKDKIIIPPTPPTFLALHPTGNMEKTVCDNTPKTRSLGKKEKKGGNIGEMF